MQIQYCRRIFIFISIILLSSIAQADTSPSSENNSVFEAIQATKNPLPAVQDWWLTRHEEKKTQIKQGNIDLLMIGDSITHFWEEEGQAIWNEYYAQRNAVNLGFSWDRTENVLWRLQNGAIEGIAPQLAVLMIGTNNTGHRKDPAEQTAAGIKRIIQELQQRLPNTKILLMGILPRKENASYKKRRLNDAVNTLIADYADNEKIFFLNINDKFIDADGVLNTDLMPDLLHPSEQGYRIWAEAMEPLIQQWVTTSTVTHVATVSTTSLEEKKQNTVTALDGYIKTYTDWIACIQVTESKADIKVCKAAGGEALQAQKAKKYLKKPAPTQTSTKTTLENSGLEKKKQSTITALDGYIKTYADWIACIQAAGSKTDIKTCKATGGKALQAQKAKKYVKTPSRARTIQAALPKTPSPIANYERRDFKYKGRDSIIISPKKIADGKPWVWRARFFDYEQQTDVALLEQGFHIAYIDVAGLFGSPSAVAIWDDFYQYLIETQGFSRKPVLKGVSRGGLMVYNWAGKNPDKVACIYAGVPVTDIRSWPAGRGSSTGSRKFWQQLLQAYELSEPQAIVAKVNPIDTLPILAAAKIPLLHVVGDTDKKVPVFENTAQFEHVYNALGGSIQVIHLDTGHDYAPALIDLRPIVQFILKHTSNNST